jgi:hypothetical protein
VCCVVAGGVCGAAMRSFSSCSSAWAGLSTTAVSVVLNYRHSCPARYPAL